MKWEKGANEGILVAGDPLTQLSHPRGLFVDTLDTLYVIDGVNNRVMRWPKDAKQGIAIVG
jgi:hypothetical protein